MKEIRTVAIIGEEDIGKTTLANALLGWDIFPQSYEYVPVPTKACASRMLTEDIRLTDTPGYSLLWGTVPEDCIQAVSQADTMIVLLCEELAEEEFDISSLDPEWEGRRAKEAALLETLLAGKTRDIYFVIPYDSQEWPEEQVPLSQGLRHARARFSHMTLHGEEGFFCVDPMKALIGAIEDDSSAIIHSGILPLKAALLPIPGKDDAYDQYPG